jgi:hypothetical protein
MTAEITYIKELAQILSEHKLDSISVGDIRITKHKYDAVKVSTKSPSVHVSDPSEDEIMSWSLSETIPEQSALMKALDSEPKKARKVRAQLT